MQFRQPSALSRVMHQILDHLTTEQVLTLEFATADDLERALAVLHELAIHRQVGVLITQVSRSQIELCLAPGEAA